MVKCSESSSECVDIPVCFDWQKLASKLSVCGVAAKTEEFLRMVESAQSTARPKAAFLSVRPVFSDGDKLILADQVFFSPTLYRTLSSANEGEARPVFPFVVTCGLELAGWASSYSGYLQSYWADVLMEEALSLALAFLERQIGAARDEGVYRLEPGTPADWPVTDLHRLKTLLDPCFSTLGVTLYESSMMHPIKTLCGIMFHSAQGFHQCSCCAHQACKNRKIDIS